jgi:predicted Zn-dependent protease
MILSHLRRLTLVTLIPVLSEVANAQSAAESQRCERAVNGSASDRTALQALSTARPLSPMRDFAAGCVHLSYGQNDSAATRLEAATRSTPNSSVAWTWLGNAYGAQASRGSMVVRGSVAPKLRDAFTRAVALDQNNVSAREGLMQFLLQAPPTMGGDKSKAAAEAAAITRINPFRGMSAQLTVAAANKNEAEVERLLTTITTQFPDSVLGWANLSALQANAQRYADAFATVARWQARGTNAMFAMFALGRTAALSGQQLDRGEQALKRYLVGQRRPVDPPFAAAHFRLGQIYERQNKRDAAIASYRAAVTMNGQYREAQEALERLRR